MSAWWWIRLAGATIFWKVVSGFFPLVKATIVAMGYTLAEESDWSAGGSLRESISSAECLNSCQDR